ncbi:MAG: universal stress protein [Pseudomonadota bacterium]
MELETCILGKASELGCDLIVMGAYGHSRTRQALFGGTTRTLLEQTSQAFFWGH